MVGAREASTVGECVYIVFSVVCRFWAIGIPTPNPARATIKKIMMDHFCLTMILVLFLFFSWSLCTS